MLIGAFFEVLSTFLDILKRASYIHCYTFRESGGQKRRVPNIILSIPYSYGKNLH